MPKYTNLSNRFVGKKHLKIPINAVDFETVYYYQDTDIITMKDEAPFYNPVKFKQIINFDGDSTTDIEFD